MVASMHSLNAARFGKIGERVVVRHMRDALLVALALGDIVDDADEILRLAVGVLHRQPRRGDNARAVAGR